MSFDDYDDDDLNSVHYGESSHYCKHGTYIGSWAGPDYMCGWCEDGVSDEEYAEMCRHAHEADERRHGERMFWSALGHTARVEREALQLPRDQALDDSWTEFCLWIVDQYRQSLRD